MTAQFSAQILYFRKLTENAYTPVKATSQSAGYDLFSAYDYSVSPQDKQLVKTDLAIKIPDGCYGRIAPRSGLALNYHIDIGAGVIDRDYRGNVGIVIFNHSKKYFKINKGDRIAQLVCEKIIEPQLIEVDVLDPTDRNDRGFGSTGGISVFGNNDHLLLEIDKFLSNNS